jgi:predicted transcriptional regulator
MEETTQDVQNEVVNEMLNSATESQDTVAQKLQELKDRRNSLEQDHLRLKELEVSVLYEELNTRNLAAIKGRMQSFITIKEIEKKYNTLVEADRVANEKAQAAQKQFAELIKDSIPPTSEN